MDSYREGIKEAVHRYCLASPCTHLGFGCMISKQNGVPLLKNKLETCSNEFLCLQKTCSFLFESNQEVPKVFMGSFLIKVFQA